MSDGDVSCTAPATRNASLRVLLKRPTPAIVFETSAKPTRLAHFWQDAESIAPAAQNDAWTSKSGPNTWCLYHFDFETCFAPPLRALFGTLIPPHWLRTRRFSRPTFRPSELGTAKHWNRCFATFLPCHVPKSSFYLLSLLWLFPRLLLHLSIS